MPERSAESLSKCVRAAVRVVARAPESDEQLLAAFVRSRDSAAFEQIVRRHGPLVLSACRHILADRSDADDACQATFVVLFRKAHSIRNGRTLGGWLFRVARRAAIEVKRADDRRRLHESRATRDERVDGPDLSWREACAILHKELDSLPAKYRLPLIACYLEGKTQDEVARDLGWSADCVRGRIERGRARLGRRLRLRGVTFSAGLVAAAAVTPDAPANIARIALQAVAPSFAVATIAQQIVGSTTRIGSIVSVATLGFALFAGAALLDARTTDPSPKQPKPLVKEPIAERADPRLDAFGDPLPDGAIARLGTVRFNHGEGMTGLQYSRDGKWILSSGGGRVRVWDAATGREIRHFSIGRKAYSDQATLTPDGRVVLVHSEAGRVAIHIWDVAEGTVVRKPELGANDSIQDQVALSPDGRLCAALRDRRWVHVIDVETGRALYELRDGNNLWAARFAGNDRLVTADTNHQIQVWDAKTGKALRKFDHGGPLGQLKASDDGRCLATLEHQTSSIDRYLDKDVVHVWNLATGTKKHTFAAPPKRWFFRLCFSEDGMKLATLAYAEPAPELLVWDTATGKLARQISNFSGFSMAFHPDGGQLAAGGGSFGITDLTTGKSMTTEDGRHALATTIALSPTGDRIAVTGYSSLSVWDGRSGRRLITHELTPFNSMHPTRTISPDARYAVTYEGNSRVGRLLVREVVTGKAVLTIDPGFVEAAFSADSSKIVTAHWNAGSKSASFVVREVSTNKVLHEIQPSKHDWLGSLSLLDDGKTVLSRGTRVAGHAVADGKELFSWRIPRAQARDIGPRVAMDKDPDAQSPWRAFTISPDGKLAAGLREFEDFGRSTLAERLYICDARTGQVLQRCNDSGRKSPNVGAVRFSNDNRLLASSDQSEVHLWDVATGKKIRTLSGHRGEIASLAFSGNGRRLATASYDSTVVMWDLSASTKAVDELPKLWDHFISDDSVKAWTAVWQLADAADDVTLPFLREHLRPTTVAEVTAIKKSIAELDSDTFRIRERAFTELTKLSHQATPALREAIGQKASVEMRNRIEQLLAKLVGPPATGEPLRISRALAVLESKRSAKAIDLLRELAAGAPEGWLSQEALAALRRIE